MRNRDLGGGGEALGNHRLSLASRAADMLLDGFCKQKHRSRPYGILRSRLHLAGARNRSSYSRKERAARKWPWLSESASKRPRRTAPNIMRKLELHSVSELVALRGEKPNH